MGVQSNYIASNSTQHNNEFVVQFLRHKYEEETASAFREPVV